LDEAELIALSQHGDHDSFQALMDWYREMLIRTAYLATRDREMAQDVVQETLVQIWRGLPGYKLSGSFRVWLMAILMNQARRQYRRKRLPLVDLAVAVNMPDEGDSPDDAAQQREQHEQLKGALELLLDDHREVLILRYYSELTVPEMALALDCLQGTVKSRINRAQGHLRKILSGDLTGVESVVGGQS
jgi:RNA polymerase sigma-70 factor (ECF subfamily)